MFKPWEKRYKNGISKENRVLLKLFYDREKFHWL